MMTGTGDMIKNPQHKKRILLTMMPYWTPLIPPQGIGMLKSFLQKQGYYVKTVDPNVEDDFKDIYNGYFKKLEEYVPKGKRGNFYNVGHDVLHNHMMAAVKYKDEKRYVELVKTLVYHTYYIHIDDTQAGELISLMDDFYCKMEKYFAALIDAEKPDVLGFSVFKGNLPASIHIARYAKQHYPGIETVMGGGVFADSHAVGSPNFDALVEETADCIDKIMVAGQGEVLFLKYLQGELPEGQRIVTLKDIGMQVIPFEELDIADLTDFDMIKYPYIAATGSASCPNECSFCNASKFFGKFRKKDVKQTVDEMTRLYKKYGTQVFFMSDSLLNPIVTDLANEFLKSDACLYYDCYFRVDEPSGNLDNTLLWRRGGLYRTRLGVESGSQKVLDLMHKGITVDQTRATLAALAEAGIKTTAYMVIGHPGETEEDFQMTLDLMEEMKDHIWQAEPNPFYYHYTGQFDSDGWSEKRRCLYPEEFREMLVFETWTLDCEPSREVRYDRLRRFMAHCEKLGIPNPYNATQLFQADERWVRLHKNAVPSIWEFKNKGKYVNEAKSVKKLYLAKNILNEGDDFDF